jgi:hypothetical protein
MTLAERQSATIDTALDALGDTRLTVEDRAGAYAVVHQVQLRLNRALRKVKDELIVYMESNHLRSLGPLSVKRTAFDVEWPINEEGNWEDATVQDTIRDVFLPIAPAFIRQVPAHYEIRTADLGSAVHMGDPVAIELHRQLRERGWRTEAGKRLSLEVKEAK